MMQKAATLDPAWFLTRVALRRDAGVAALAPLLLPDEDGARAEASHRLVWSLFPGDADATRDFLYREEGRGRVGRFTILSRRRPVDLHGLFAMEEPKIFAPALKAGDRLAFALRANPTVERKEPGQTRSLRSDVVMHRLKPIPKGDRAKMRDTLTREAIRNWLERQALRSGFQLVCTETTLRVDGYDQVRLPRRKGKPILFSRVDTEGVLEITDPAEFIRRVTGGFGRAKAFGCGLMLIRRAPK